MFRIRLAFPPPDTHMPSTPTRLKIDFVADISCPWCAIGLQALDAAGH